MSLQIVVISNPEPVKNESEIINDLFEAGLELFHLRKQNAIETELIENIDEKYHNRIALHQSFGLTKKFGIKRLHFSEKTRSIYMDSELKDIHEKGFILSASIHSIDDYNNINRLFHYVLIGPVFESISKPGYKPIADLTEQVNKIKNRETRIVGIGGVNHSKLEKMNDFDGAALLGAIWKNPERAVEEFTKCKKIINTILTEDRLY